MRCLDFIRTRSSTWVDLERSLKSLGAGEKSAPDMVMEFLRRYRRTVADLSLARTLFPGDDLVRHLNALVIKALIVIGARVEPDRTRVSRFFAVRLPQLILTIRSLFLVSAAIFVLSAAAGFSLASLNPFAANAIVGDQYICMTLENIEAGKPFAVYQAGFKYLMSGFIMANNIKVSFVAFGLGIFYGVGTFAVLISNGLMLGAITAVFAQNHLLGEFLATVLVHGTLELFAIMVAGAAGLRLGQSVFRPGTLRRSEALMRFGIEAFQICLIMVPLLVIAAIVEGYVTPLGLPVIARLAIIFASLLVIVLWTVVPVIRYRFLTRPQGTETRPAFSGARLIRSAPPHP